MHWWAKISCDLETENAWHVCTWMEALPLFSVHCFHSHDCPVRLPLVILCYCWAIPLHIYLCRGQIMNFKRAKGDGFKLKYVWNLLCSPLQSTQFNCQKCFPVFKQFNYLSAEYTHAHTEFVFSTIYKNTRIQVFIKSCAVETQRMKIVFAIWQTLLSKVTYKKQNKTKPNQYEQQPKHFAQYKKTA